MLMLMLMLMLILVLILSTPLPLCLPLNPIFIIIFVVYYSYSFSFSYSFISLSTPVHKIFLPHSPFLLHSYSSSSSYFSSSPSLLLILIHILLLLLSFTLTHPHPNPHPLLHLLSILVTHTCKLCFSFSSGVKYGWPKELTWIVTDPYLLSCTPQPQPQQQQQKQHDSSASALCDIAFLQYTSGSTSDPKGVMITHDNLTDNLQLILSGLEATEDTVVVSWLPQYHDMGLIGSYLGALYCGGSGYYLSPISFIRNPTTWVQAMSKYKATHAQAPNFAYALTARKYLAQSRLKQMKKSGSQELNLSSLRHMINAGAVIDTYRVLYYYSACVCV
jgi:AMP-binding enzyme